MNENSRIGLYGVMAVGCGIWLVDSVTQSLQQGTWSTWPELVFDACMVVAVIYCVVNACMLAIAVRGRRTRGQHGQTHADPVTDAHNE